MEENERKAECKKKKLCSFVGAGLRTRPQNGITLIALIITVIVMLILVGVTINVALNGGLFTQAQTAAEETQIEADREQLLSSVVGAIGTDAKVDFNKLDSNLPTGWTGSNGTYTSPKGNVFTVDEKGTIDHKGKNTTGEGGTPTGNNTVPDELTKYIMGEDGKGRVLIGTDEEGNDIGILAIDDTGEFLDDPLTEDVNEKETLGVNYLTNLTGDSNLFLYAKYDNKVYKITADYQLRTEKLEMIYEPNGREGETTEEGWTILYDYGETVEAVSPTVMGELRLGYSETATTSQKKSEEAIESYNNAILLINNYCKTLEGLPENKGVRSVGSSKETIDKYYSDTISSWNSEYNGVGNKGDINLEQDLVRMSYWGVFRLGSEYWIASRYVSEGSEDIMFRIRKGCRLSDDNATGSVSLWKVGSVTRFTAYSEVRSVRPVITIEI